MKSATSFSLINHLCRIFFISFVMIFLSLYCLGSNIFLWFERVNLIFRENNLLNKYLKGLYWNSLSLNSLIKNIYLKCNYYQIIFNREKCDTWRKFLKFLLPEDRLDGERYFFLIKLSCSFLIDLNLEILSKWSNLKWPYCLTASPIKWRKKIDFYEL